MWVIKIEDHQDIEISVFLDPACTKYSLVVSIEPGDHPAALPHLQQPEDDLAAAD